MDRLYHLYQRHSKQGNHFSLCSSGNPLTILPATRAQPCFLARAPPGTDVQNFRLCALLFMKNRQHWNPLLFPRQYFWGTVFLCNLLGVFSLFFPPLYFSLSLSLRSELPSHHRSCHSFLPPVNSAIPTFYGLFFVHSHAVLLSKTSDWFTGCSEWFEIYIAVQGRRQA